jgi:predicted transcriptional regulator
MWDVHLYLLLDFVVFNFGKVDTTQINHKLELQITAITISFNSVIREGYLKARKDDGHRRLFLCQGG